MAYEVKPLVSFERAFARLPKSDQQRIAEKIDFLATHPETIGSPMAHLPSALRGLHKIRAGDWRIFFWVDTRRQEITLYDVDRRDKAYKSIMRR
ncbi:MAG: hypothetical protein AAB916_01550 [Patescibacteria group bacterium]